jgi:Fur family ferric uptake transcriptional regulator
MSENIEQKCLAKGVKLTEQRKIIVKVLSESKETYGESDHPDVDELYNRVSKVDPKISIATVYRTVKILEEAGILVKHDFKGLVTIEYVDVPQLCKKYKIKKNLINPIYLS